MCRDDLQIWTYIRGFFIHISKSMCMNLGVVPLGCMRCSDDGTGGTCGQCECI